MKTLTNREKFLLKILIICIAAVVVYYLIITPLMKISGSSEDVLSDIRSDLETLDNLYNQYKDVQQKK